MDANPGNYNGNDPGVIHHAETSRRLSRQAADELEKRGDRVQASDKAAGAGAHAVKAVAEARHWHHARTTGGGAL